MEEKSFHDPAVEKMVMHMLYLVRILSCYCSWDHLRISGPQPTSSSSKDITIITCILCIGTHEYICMLFLTFTPRIPQSAT